MKFLNRQTIKPALITAITGIFIGFLSPFGMDKIPLHISIIYWVLVCTTGYFVYRPCIATSESLLAKYFEFRLIRLAIGVVVASAIFSLVVPLITWGVFNFQIDYRTEYLSIFSKALVIGSALTLIGYAYEHIKAQNARIADNEKQAQEYIAQIEDDDYQQFMELLPLEKRGELICLEMADHYIKVYTDKGHHMLLMRFKDAIEKLSNFNGIQTHRSWWVAIEQVTATTKEGRKQLLVMSNEVKVPVSRTYADAVKAAKLT